MYGWPTWIDNATGSDKIICGGRISIKGRTVPPRAKWEEKTRRDGGNKVNLRRIRHHREQGASSRVKILLRLQLPQQLNWVKLKTRCLKSEWERVLATETCLPVLRTLKCRLILLEQVNDVIRHAKPIYIKFLEKQWIRRHGSSAIGAFVKQHQHHEQLPPCFSRKVTTAVQQI